MISLFVFGKILSALDNLFLSQEFAVEFTAECTFACDVEFAIVIAFLLLRYFCLISVCLVMFKGAQGSQGGQGTQGQLGSKVTKLSSSAATVPRVS